VQSANPIRIGIWCDGGGLPGEVSTGFIGALADGLLDLDQQLEVVLFVCPEDSNETAVLPCRSEARLQVVPLLKAESGLPGWLASILGKWGPRFEGWRVKEQIARKLMHGFRSRIADALRGFLTRTRLKFQKSPLAGFPLLIPGVFLASSAFLVYWTLYVLKQFIGAGWRSVILPWSLLSRLEKIRRFAQLVKVGLDPLSLAKGAGCDVWLIPSLTFRHSLNKLPGATVMILPESPPWQFRQNLSGTAQEEMQCIASSHVTEATLCVSLSTAWPEQNWQKLWQVDPAKIRRVQPFPNNIESPETAREVRPKAQKEAVQEWLAVFREAVEVGQWRSTFDQQVINPASNRSGPRWLAVLRKVVAGVRWRASLDHQLVKPWPRLETAPASPREPLKAFLFLPYVYYGGVLQVVRELVSELAALNRQRQRLHLTLGLLEDQGSTQFLDQLDKAVVVQRMRLNPIRRPEVIQLCGGVPPWLADRPEHEFCFFSGAAQAAFHADAWFSLIDRFPLPLLPARPLGIVVQDVIQRRHPEIFGMVFFRNMAAGIIPTARSAEAIVTMTPQTHDDVIAIYGVDPSRVRLIPVACNPEWHFNQVTARPVANIREPFILNVTNCSPHKGADVILRAYALLKRRLGPAAPLLVLCGFRTEGFSQTQERYDGPPWQTIRRLVRDLGLVENRDVVFLGTVNDEQLQYLYQHCCVVVNAARYDNGCLCLAEGAYFGRPAVSSRYPAAEFHAQRFGYQAHFFPVGDAAGLAEALGAALKEPLATVEDIQRARARFQDPEFSFRRYSERIYDLLILLAEKGRAQKAGEKLSGISIIDNRGSRIAS
jgi:glycosyltransferase involved in cell wall biosynthesis